MNFLAHAYLSFNHPELLVGNMISDFVKGRKKFDYSTGIQKGIHLHRQIDAFTDAHQMTKEAKEYLKPAVGPYAGAFVDVAYDHFLANDITEFSELSLYNHAHETYTILQSHEDVLPQKFQMILPYMQGQNWLFNYRTLKGLYSSFGGVVRRAKYLNNSENVYQLFVEHYEPLQKCYNDFFPAVKAFAFHQIEQLLNDQVFIFEQKR